jgi:hypothetical protein
MVKATLRPADSTMPQVFAPQFERMPATAGVRDHVDLLAQIA